MTERRPDTNKLKSQHEYAHYLFSELMIDLKCEMSRFEETIQRYSAYYHVREPVELMPSFLNIIQHYSTSHKHLCLPPLSSLHIHSLHVYRIY